jgi:hypothetical protein
MADIKISEHIAKHPKMVCPFCDYKVNASSQLSGKDNVTQIVTPRDGDFSLCPSCGMILRFSKVGEGELSFVLATPDEMVMLRSQDEKLFDALIKISRTCRMGFIKKPD